MGEFHIKIRSSEIKDAEIIQAIQADQIVSHSDGTMAECLVKLFARRVGDQRNLRTVAKLGQQSGENILSRLSFLRRSRQEGNQNQEKCDRSRKVRRHQEFSAEISWTLGPVRFSGYPILF